MISFYRNLFLFFVFCFSTLESSAQLGPEIPFSLSIEPIQGTFITGTHSSAIAKSGDKWLVIGGRINGLHGLNSNDGFPTELANEYIIVLDTTSWTESIASLNQLPASIADPLRSTNMEYIHIGSYLYMIGGYGRDNVAGMFVTFPKLTAIHVDSMINAVLNGESIAPHIRQITDSRFQVCGGELGNIGQELYLLFGHNFGGRYTDPPTSMFTQTYTDRITKFSLLDDGTNLTPQSFVDFIDTNYFHRRDLNVGPIIKSNGEFGLKAYSGVFQKTRNLPFRETITITQETNDINTSYEQVMSHYNCAMIPIFDTLTKKMYTTFLGGMSLYNYMPSVNAVVYDSLIPFISDITTMTTHSDGTMEETIMATQLPGLLGSNAKFILNTGISHFSNEIIDIRSLSNAKTLIGYLYGGIRAEEPNLGASTANDTIYRIYLIANNSNSLTNIENELENVLVYPVPASNNLNINFQTKNPLEINVTLFDLNLKKISSFPTVNLNSGKHTLPLSVANVANGFYYLEIKSETGIIRKKVQVFH
jgi:hypothetical protein